MEAISEDTEMRQTLEEDQLRRIPDFQRLSKKFQRKKANLQDCYRVYQAVEKLPYILETLEKNESSYQKLLMDVFTNPIKVLTVNVVYFHMCLCVANNTDMFKICL